MIDKIEINQFPIESGSSLKQINTGSASPDNDMDVSVRVDNANLIKMAMQIPESDPRQIEKARDLLLSGQLETSENILEAAKNLYDYGV